MLNHKYILKKKGLYEDEKENKYCNIGQKKVNIVTNLNNIFHLK